MTDRDLYVFFSQNFGPVEFAQGYRTGRNHYAFVTFVSKETAVEVMKASNVTLLNGHRLRVGWTRNKSKTQYTRVWSRRKTYGNIPGNQNRRTEEEMYDYSMRSESGRTSLTNFSSPESSINLQSQFSMTEESRYFYYPQQQQLLPEFLFNFSVPWVRPDAPLGGLVEPAGFTVPPPPPPPPAYFLPWPHYAQLYSPYQFPQYNQAQASPQDLGIYDFSNYYPNQDNNSIWEG